MANETVARDFVKELEAALKALASKMEGFQQLERTQVDNPADAEAVRIAIALRARRKAVLDNALASATALLDDDYPKMPKIVVTKEVFQDIRDNIAEQQDAFGEFVVRDETATQLNPALGTAEPKVPKTA